MSRRYHDCCIYCGDFFQARDHVVPCAWDTPGRYFSNGEIVSSCHQCNSMLGSKALHDIPSRAEHLHISYTKRKNNLDKVPVWTEEQLGEMGYNMQMKILATMHLKILIDGKVSNTERVMYGQLPRPLHDTWASLLCYDIIGKRNSSVKKFEKAIANAGR